MKPEAGPELYDAGYSVNKTYFKHYSKCQYMRCWQPILEGKKLLAPQDRVLDLGCGPGQFAEYVKDIGVENYTGVDFSSVAIEQATKRLTDSNFSFYCGDIYTCDLPEEVDVVVSLEVLEHIAQDRKLLKRLAQLYPGTKFVFSVPNFDHSKHVRFFENRESITSRFSDFCDIDEIMEIRMGKKKRIWIFHGRLAQAQK